MCNDNHVSQCFCKALNDFLSSLWCFHDYKKKTFEIREKERLTLAVPYTLEEPMSDKPREEFELDLR